MEQFLPINEHTKGRCLRSEETSRIERSINRGGHDSKLSVFKRQEKLFDLFLKQTSNEGILGMKTKVRKKLVEEFILNAVSSEQNRIRNDVKQGQLKNPDTNWRTWHS